MNLSAVNSQTKNNFSTNETGLSLIELIISTAVAGILIVIIMGFLTDRLVLNATLSARSNMIREAQIALEVINSDIKHASGVDDINRWGDDHPPISGDPYSWRPGPDVLLLAAPAKNSSQEFLYEDPFAYITHKNNYIYFVNGGVLYKRILPADIPDNAAQTTCPTSVPNCINDIELINNVVDFRVSYFDASDEEVEPDEARSAQVFIQIEDSVYGREVTANHTVRSVFRNE